MNAKNTIHNISILVPKSRMVTLQVEGDRMKMSTKSDLGAAQETVAIKRDPLLKERDKSDLPAPSMTAFSVDLLTNILNHIGAKGVVMSLDMNKAESIAIIKPNDSLGYLYLLMPMRLQ